MGGFNSGRRRVATWANVHEVLSLNVNHLRRQGCLRPGWLGALECRSPQGTVTARIGLCADRTHLWVTCGLPGGQPGIQFPLEIVWRGCRFGGRRPYFRCPLSREGGCYRAVTRLYWTGSAFRCRRCARLSYACQNQSALDRTLDRALRLRARLGPLVPGTGHLFEPEWDMPPRPKRMWRQTYQRRVRQLAKAEIAANAAYRAVALRVLATNDHHHRRG